MDSSEPSPYLIVDQFGCSVGKHSERLQVKKEKKVIAEMPLLHLEGVVIAGRGISMSADVIAACADAGIPVHFLSGTGHPVASLFSAGLTGTVQTRREQLTAYADARGVALAKAFVAGKIANQASLLRYMAKYRKETEPSRYDDMR
jgi:CRISP-associated protein Cas1